MSDSEKHFELAVELSRDAQKALLLVNGGAATALVALMEKTGTAHNFTAAIIYFAAATVSSVIASCFGYFSQLNYANHRLSSEQKDDNGARSSHVKHCWWQAAAIAAVIVTLIFMVFGMITAARIAS